MCSGAARLGLRSGLISKIFFLPIWLPKSVIGCLVMVFSNFLMVARQPEDLFSLQIQDLYPIIFDSYLNRYFSIKNKNNKKKEEEEKNKSKTQIQTRFLNSAATGLSPAFIPRCHARPEMENLTSSNCTAQNRSSKLSKLSKLLEPNLSLNDTRHSRLERQVSTNSDSCLPNVSSGYSSNELESFTGDEQLYRVLYDYKPNHYDELTLTKNSLVKLVSKDVKISGDEGWWTGVNLGEAKRGIFPSNYVTPYEPDDETDRSQLPPQVDYSQLEIQECIGAGGFGKVFKGFWLQNGRRKELVAIKKARVEVDTDELLNTIKQSVLNEAKLFWALRHPNIIELKGMCLNEPHFCLIMECAKGGSLGRLLSVRKIGFPPNILIRWALQVSHGMHYLHEQALPNKVPIVHRDLKSSNILLSEDALSGHHKLKDIVLKLTDFGLARQLEKTTNEMSQAGTYSHMPPEVIKSSKYSKASDVWSFGVLLWELLTGEVPYKGIDPLAIAYGVAVNKLTLPVPTSCPKIFAELIHGCWRTDPHTRLSFGQIIAWLTDISNSAFAATSNELFWTMQQDWKCEIQQMFDEIKERESELRNREQELEKISMRQQAYENVLRQRERELEQREKELAVRELTMALQKLNPVPPEPKKRRKTKLLSNFLRSSSSSSSNSHAISSNPQLTKSFDISSPSDFHHCLSVQPELLVNNSSAHFVTAGADARPSSSSTPTDHFSQPLGTTASSSGHFVLSPISPNASPNLRLKIMLPNGHQSDLSDRNALSPKRSRQRALVSGANSSTIDITSQKANSHASRAKQCAVDTARSASNDLESSGKKISKILYEIGSMLSFVGLGKDYKHQNRPSEQKKCAKVNPEVESGASQSHSLTRFHKTCPYRFKSLSNHGSANNAAPNVLVVQSAHTSNLSSSSSNLLSPKSAMLSSVKLNNQEILKKYSKSIDCPKYLPSDESRTVTRQKSVNCSPLIPRRSDYEPVARVTIQRQQRVEQSPPKLMNFLSVEVPDGGRLPRPLTLDLRKSFVNEPLSTTSTNEDEYLDFEAKDRPQANRMSVSKCLPLRDSLSLSVSSVLSSSQPSSVSPVASPRLSNRQSHLLKQMASHRTVDETNLHQK
ncbi:mitogen-activated kinase kinase kinase MLK4-like isoform X2 [Brachionus plicatilis]|uniref:mitogen-activated protein kinase kinase kinase n=1 Tax=Brachionus plicatilis TaxID=10195 RepID=A0A3M7PT45_BRAPC|nr:mitogen-activated kinase kinase kinase MLK4-like isoform X2 [Brachionus plicatilis]